MPNNKAILSHVYRAICARMMCYRVSQFHVFKGTWRLAESTRNCDNERAYRVMYLNVTSSVMILIIFLYIIGENYERIIKWLKWTELGVLEYRKGVNGTHTMLFNLNVRRWYLRLLVARDVATAENCILYFRYLQYLNIA